MARRALAQMRRFAFTEALQRALTRRSAAALVGAAVWLAVRCAAADPACPPVVAPPTAEEARAAVQTARDRGALWTIEKDARRSWLYGTIHVGNLEMAALGPKVRAALTAAQVLAIEVDVTSAATVRAFSAPPPPDAPAVPPALVERMKALAAKACVPWEPLSSRPPMIIASALTILESRRDGLDPAFATEFVLSGFARAKGMPVVALESVETQRRAMIGPPAADQFRALEGAISAIEQDRVRPTARALAKAWSDGDLATLASYEQWCGCAGSPQAKAYLDHLVFARNEGLAAAVDRLHGEGRSVFAATGILHMVGDGGLPRRLEKLGYTVERVAFDAPPAADRDRR